MKEVKKLRMKLRINALEWNPMEAMMLTVASEDYKYVEEIDSCLVSMYAVIVII